MKQTDLFVGYYNHHNNSKSIVNSLRRSDNAHIFFFLKTSLLIHNLNFKPHFYFEKQDDHALQRSLSKLTENVLRKKEMMNQILMCQFSRADFE